MTKKFKVYANRDMSSKRRIVSAEESPDEFDLPQVEQKFSSKKTAVNGKQGKLPAIFKLVSFPRGTLNLDYGGGTEDAQAVADAYFADKDVQNLIYDVYNQTAEHNREVVKQIRANGGADTATLSNVLNVIAEPESRMNVLQNIRKLLKSSGTLYVTVYEGAKANRGQGKQTGEDQFQTNMALADYLEEIQQVFPNATRKGKLIIAPNGGSVGASTSIKKFKVTASEESKKRNCCSSDITASSNLRMQSKYLFNQLKDYGAYRVEADGMSVDVDTILFVDDPDVVDFGLICKKIESLGYNLLTANRGNPEVVQYLSNDNKYCVNVLWYSDGGIEVEVSLENGEDEMDDIEFTTSVEASIDGDDYQQYWKDTFAPIVREEVYQMGIQPDSEDADISPKSIKHVFKCYFAKQDAKKIQGIMRALEARVKKAVTKTHWCESAKLEYSLDHNFDPNTICATVYVTAMAAKDDDVWGAEDIMASNFNDAEQYWYDEFEPMLAEVANKCGLEYDDPQANPSDSSVYHRFLTYIKPNAKRQFEKKFKQFESAAKAALANTKWPEYIKINYSYLDTNAAGSIPIEISIQAEAPEDDSYWTPPEEKKSEYEDSTIEGARYVAECGLNKNVASVDDSVSGPSEKFPWPHFFINQFDVGMLVAYEENGAIKIEDAETCELLATCKSDMEYDDYLQRINSSASQMQDEAEGRYSANAATEIDGAHLPERPLDPPEYDEPTEVDDSQEEVEFNFDCDVLVGENGWDYADQSYSFAQGPGSRGNWYAEESGVYLGDKTSMVEYLDEILMNLLPEAAGVYHISGIAHLKFDVSGVYKYSDFQGMDEDNDPIIDESYDTDTADARFNRDASYIENFNCELVSNDI